MLGENVVIKCRTWGVAQQVWRNSEQEESVLACVAPQGCGEEAVLELSFEGTGRNLANGAEAGLFQAG